MRHGDHVRVRRRRRVCSTEDPAREFDDPPAISPGIQISRMHTVRPRGLRRERRRERLVQLLHGYNPCTGYSSVCGFYPSLVTRSSRSGQRLPDETPSSVDVLHSDQLASQRLNDEGLPPIGRHPIPHVLQCPPNGGRRNAVVASEILVGHVRTVLQLHPLRRRVPTRAFGGLNCSSQGKSSTDSRYREALPSKCHGNRRLGERGRTITTPLRGKPPQILPVPAMTSCHRQYGTTISALLPLRLEPDPSEARWPTSGMHSQASLRPDRARCTGAHRGRCRDCSVPPALGKSPCA